MQRTLLESNPSAPVRVYAVWFKMYPGDARDRWRPNLLDDPRVLHFWDDAQAMGRLFFAHLPTLAAQRVSPSIAIEGDVLWDAYLLYGPKAEWKDADVTAGVVSWGSTILTTQDDFLHDFLTLMAQSQASGRSRHGGFIQVQRNTAAIVPRSIASTTNRNPLH